MVEDVNFPNEWGADYLRKTDGWEGESQAG